MDIFLIIASSFRLKLKANTSFKQASQIIKVCYSVIIMNWTIKNQAIPQSVKDLLKILFKNRQIDDPNQFFSPPSPLAMQPQEIGLDLGQITKAVSRLKQAKQNQEKVVIFGDYDADGICASAILWLALKKIGLVAQPFIPDRQRHGYGISIKALKELVKTQNPDLIITVDNGIVANKALQWAKEQDLAVIVTDHHQPAAKLPPALALIYSTKVCGASVAWFLAKALLASDVETTQSLLDLAGLATITDQMRLVKANRSFAKYGLEQLRQSPRTGLAALMKIAKVRPKTLKAYHLGFVLGPRINAAGRIGNSLEALRLLCTQDEKAAAQLAKKLDLLNQKRQDLTKDLFALALKEHKKWAQEHLIFVAHQDYHEGIIGLIAGQLCEKYAKPAIVVSLQDQQAKASARSVKGVNIIELIRMVQEDLLSAGGHKLAAGFSLSLDKLDQVRQQLMKLAKEEISAELLQPSAKAECELPASLISFKTIKLIDKLAPFGLGNPQPKFILKKLQLIEALTMGKEDRHLRLILQSPIHAHQQYKAVGWNLGYKIKELKPGLKLDLLTKLEINAWNGKNYLQLNFKDFKIT